MKSIDIKNLDDWYTSNHQEKLTGRRVLLEHIKPILEKLKTPFEIQKIGESEQKQEIFSVSIGRGKKRILTWSQMHGNESTGTKAMFDLFKYIAYFLGNSDSFVDRLLSECTLVFIPMLNPRR